MKIYDLIPLITTVVAAYVTIMNFKKNNTKDLSNDIASRVERDTKISTKLDMLILGNTELKNELKNTNEKFDEINERLVRVEESTKQAHKRINECKLVKGV